jgi:hypothetical protein
MAEALANFKKGWKVHYVLPGPLRDMMLATMGLASILENPRITFLVYDPGDEVTTKKENGRLMRLYQKRKYIPGILQKWLIMRYSQRFYTFMANRLQPRRNS